MTMPTLDLIPGAEPFFIQGNELGCLLIHGFTATPNEVRLLGHYLGEQGYTVLGPRLAHHGSTPDDMRRSRFHDWYLSALDGWHLLKGSCRQIVVIGLSMGGSAALLLAARQPVAGVVSMSAPLHIPPDPRLRIVRYYGRVRPFLPKSGWDESQRASRYSVTPTVALHALQEYLRAVQAALPQVKAPALLMHSRTDSTVAPENMEQIYAALGSEQKEMVWWEDAAHVMTEDPRHRQAVFERVATFVGQCMQEKPSS
jgi:carboxylesterase